MNPPAFRCALCGAPTRSSPFRPRECMTDEFQRDERGRVIVYLSCCLPCAMDNPWPVTTEEQCDEATRRALDGAPPRRFVAPPRTPARAAEVEEYEASFGPATAALVAEMERGKN